MTNISILSLNCRGLKGNKKRLKVFQYLKELKSDICCLQDTHFIPEQENDIYSEWGTELFLSYGSNSSRGVAILLTKNLDYKINNTIIDKNGNYIIIDITIGENKLTLASLYGPNTDKPDFYSNIMNKIDQNGNEYMFVCLFV